MTVDLIPPSRSNYPVTSLTFDGGCDFVTVDGFDVFFGVGCGAILNLIRKTNSGVHPVRIKTSLFYSLVEMLGPDNLTHYLISLTRSGSSTKGLEGISTGAVASGAEGWAWGVESAGVGITGGVGVLIGIGSGRGSGLTSAR